MKNVELKSVYQYFTPKYSDVRTNKLSRIEGTGLKQWHIERKAD